MKQIGVVVLLAAVATGTVVGQGSSPGVKVIPGQRAIERALNLPQHAGIFRRGVPRWFKQQVTSFWVEDMDRYPRFRRPHTAEDNPPSNRQACFATYYVGPASHLKLLVTIADHSEVLINPDSQGPADQLARGKPGSFTGQKLAGRSWHVGNLGASDGVRYLILQTGNVQVFADLQMWAFESGKIVQHPGPSMDQARGVEALAETALKNAVGYRDRGFK